MNTKTQILKLLSVDKDIRALTKIFSMQKIKLDIKVKDAIRLALVKMCPIPKRDFINLANAHEAILAILDGRIRRKFTENDVRELCESNILRHDDNDSRIWNIYRQDVENYILIMSIPKLQDELKLAEQGTHPETGKDIEILYTPANNRSKGLSRLDNWTLLRLTQIKDKNVLDILTKSIEEATKTTA